MTGKSLIQLLHPTVRTQCLQLLSRCTRQGIELLVTQTFRSFVQQGELYVQGREVGGPIVTNAPPGFSFHNWGIAFDVAINKFPQDRTPKNLYDGPWEVVGEIGEAVGLEWGGHWKHPDQPHFENRMRWTIKALLEKWPQGLPDGATWPSRDAPR